MKACSGLLVRCHRLNVVLRDRHYRSSEMNTPAPSSILQELTYLADELLRTAETLFGPRAQTEWTFVGVEIYDLPPHLAYYPEQGWVAISLSQKAMEDHAQCIFQLAHEVCHLLYPTANRKTGRLPPTIVLNEGVSTHFSLLMCERLKGTEAYQAALSSLRSASPSYYEAMLLTDRLLNEDPDTIKKVRSVQPMLNDVTEEDFAHAGVSVTAEAASTMLATFKEHPGSKLSPPDPT